MSGLAAVDERDIIAVLLRYATGIDHRDWSLFESCFTPDARTDYGLFGRWSTAAEITSYMRTAHADLGRTLHRMTNFVISGGDGHAIAESYVDALLMPGVAGGDIHRGIGVYDDRFVRTGEGWRIASRVFTATQIV